MKTINNHLRTTFFAMSLFTCLPTQTMDNQTTQTIVHVIAPIGGCLLGAAAGCAYEIRKESATMASTERATLLGGWAGAILTSVIVEKIMSR